MLAPFANGSHTKMRKPHDPSWSWPCDHDGHGTNHVYPTSKLSINPASLDVARPIPNPAFVRVLAAMHLWVQACVRAGRTLCARMHACLCTHAPRAGIGADALTHARFVRACVCLRVCVCVRAAWA